MWKQLTCPYRQINVTISSSKAVVVLTFLSAFIVFSGCLCSVCTLFPSCVPVLLPGLLLPPHLSCFSLVSPTLFPVFPPANQLLTCSPASSPHSPLLSLSTCTSLHCQYIFCLCSDFSSMFVELPACSSVQVSGEGVLSYFW